LHNHAGLFESEFALAIFFLFITRGQLELLGDFQEKAARAALAFDKKGDPGGRGDSEGEIEVVCFFAK
jgi:hypothetical protein